jgi:hypothetical protein
MKIKFLRYSLLIVCFFAIANAGFAYTELPTEKTVLPVDLNSVDIYPNPATEFIYLKFQDEIAQDVAVEVRSFIGNEMVTSQIVEQTNLIKVSISDLPAGHYYAIISHDGEKTLKKFIKKA